MKHAIKIEDILTLDRVKADLMVETFTEILKEIGFTSDRIEEVSCRRYDGFIPYNYNKGGIRALCYTSNSVLHGSGYDYGDSIIQNWSEERHELYSNDHPLKLRYINQVQSGKRSESKLYYTVLEHYYNYIDGCSDYDSTQFEVRFMVLEDGSVDVDVFGTTTDAPYFRGSDYNANRNFKFRGKASFKKQVMNFLNECDCVDLIRECY